MASTNVSPEVSLKEILIVTDLSSASEMVLSYVLALAKRYHSHVTLLHSLGPVPYMPVPDMPGSTLYTQQLDVSLPVMERLAGECKSNGVACGTVIKDGELWQVVNQQISQQRPDLIACGASCHGRLHKLLLGSHTENILRHAPCAVLLVGPKAAAIERKWEHGVSKILVATDFDDGSRHALEYVRPLAADFDSTVLVLHVIPDIGAISMGFEEAVVERNRQALETFVRSTAFRRLPKLVSRIGMRAQEIVAVAVEENADLLVMGKRKGGAFATHSAPSIVSTVVEEAPCPVLAIC